MQAKHVNSCVCVMSHIHDDKEYGTMRVYQILHVFEKTESETYEMQVSEWFFHCRDGRTSTTQTSVLLHQAEIIDCYDKCMI
jgi:hypothetical protein